MGISNLVSKNDSGTLHNTYLNAMLCPIKVNSSTIELTMHTSCYCVLDLLCVN